MPGPANNERATRLYRAATPIDEEDIHPGTVVGEGRFEIVNIIGRGKMASVFRARDLRRDTDIALKVLARKFVGRLESERRFDNEARLAGRLQGHRNVVAPSEAGRLTDRGGRMFLVMDLVRGPTLADLISMYGPLRIDDACMYIRDVGRALRDLHQSGVVHRDVKPANIIAVENKKEGRLAKLLDFGLAADTGSGVDTRMTRMGERPGTRHYMSPEQAWDAPAHPIFDIYALGVTFYEMLTGHPPFFELDEAEVIARKCDLSQPAPTIKGKRGDLPPRLDILIDACLEPLAKKRLPSANAFLKRLDAIVEGMEGAGTISPRTRQQTGMVGKARTVQPNRRKKSRLPELMAQAAAAKQQPAAPEEPVLAPEAPTPDPGPDRVVSRRAVNRAVQGLVESAAALGSTPAAVPHLQPTAPVPQAKIPTAPAATPGMNPPMPAHAPMPAGVPMAGVAPMPAGAAPMPAGMPMAGAAPMPAGVPMAGAARMPAAAPVPPSAQVAAPAPRPSSPSVAPPRRAAPRRRRRRQQISGSRAVLIGLFIGALLSALVVTGLWIWVLVRTS